jgi:hypothetical protein
MAYPSPGTPQATSFNSSVSSMAVNMPASTTSGDLLIAVVEVRNPGTWTLPSGWTQLFSPVSAGGVGDLTVFYRTATGSEGGTTETWTASVATTGVWLTVDISGWDGSSTPAYATKNSGGSPSTNSFNTVTPSWGSATTLWLALYGNTANGTTVSSAPSGYSGLTVQSTISGGGSYCCVAYADLQATATSETPGAFSTSSDRWWMTAAIAIKPASGGSPKTNTQSAKARIAVNLTKTQSAVARIQETLSTMQSARARISVSKTVTQSSTARVAVNSTKTQQSTARLQKTATSTQLATGRIQQLLSVTQTAKARIADNFTKTQSAVTRISNTLAKTQPSIARVSVVASKVQTATARITGGALSKTQSGIG